MTQIPYFEIFREVVFRSIEGDGFKEAKPKGRETGKEVKILAQERCEVALAKQVTWVWRGSTFEI